MYISLIDDVVKGSHIIYHSNKNNLVSKRRAINNYARTTQGRTILNKLECIVTVGSLMGEQAIIKCLSYQKHVAEAIDDAIIERKNGRRRRNVRASNGVNSPRFRMLAHKPRKYKPFLL